MSVLSMTKTLFKSLLHGPYTEKYPIEKKDPFERTRGKVEINIVECIYCGICQKRCPTAAINVEKDKTKWSIQRLQCIQCGYCVEGCPKKCLSMDNHYTAPSFDKDRDDYTNA
jgi:formate hydrogenlyase subunit 6/NADH:ubiquinone oxidoreductase subunit I